MAHIVARAVPDDDWEDLLRPTEPGGSTPDDAPVAGTRWTPSPTTPLRPGRRRVLVALAGLPWVGAGIGLAVARTSAVSTQPATPTPSGTAIDLGTAGPKPPAAVASAASGPATRAIPDADRRLEAVAMLVAHAHVRERGDYADHAAIERVVRPRSDAAVVVVLLGVLGPQGDGWSAPWTERLAIPLRFAGADPVLAATPWPLPVTSPGPSTPPDLVLVDDPEVLDHCASALLAAGWSDVRVAGASSDGAWPLVVDVTATPPGSRSPAARQLWFEPTPDGWHLVGGAGTAPATELATPTSPTPPTPTEGTAP